MDHRARWYPLASKDVEEIIEGSSGVHDEGKVELLREGDLGRKGLALLVFRRMLVEVVESAFTDADEAIVSRARELDDWRDVILRVVGMQPDGREQLDGTLELASA